MSCKLILPDRLHWNVLLSSISEKLICWTRGDQNLHWTVQTCLANLSCSHHDPNIANLPTDVVLRSILQLKTRTTGRRRKKKYAFQAEFSYPLARNAKKAACSHSTVRKQDGGYHVTTDRGPAGPESNWDAYKARWVLENDRWMIVGKNFYFERLREALLVFLHKAFQLCSLFRVKEENSACFCGIESNPQKKKNVLSTLGPHR